MGGGNKNKAPRQPVIQPDTIRSTAIIEIVEALCEGQIEGFATADPLQSIYLDDTPIKSGDNLNFQGASVDYRLGTQNQTYIPGTIDDAAAAPVVVDVVVEHDTPVVRTINDTTTDAIRVTLLVESLFFVDTTTGDRTGTTLEIRIEVKPQGGSWQTADLSGRQIISGKTESPYERSYQIPFDQFAGSGPGISYDVRVSRISANPVTGQYSTFRWSSYTKLSYAKLRHPNTAVVRATFDAQYFSQMPKRGYLLKGAQVRVPPPSVWNPVTRLYTGADWDGTFVTAWTRNPAWIFYDIVTHSRYGLGRLIGSSSLDKWALFQIAKRCDEHVPDGQGGTEPRYSLDLYLQQDDDAKKVILDIASAFDAMAYWGSGVIHVTQDAPKTATALYTPANVVDGRFNYAGSARQVRYTVALVQWNDPADQYRIATEYVEDREGIERYGYREKTIAAIGCTSRGQAHRAGKRILLTSRMETDSVSFAVGLDGLNVRPGDIIRIADPLRAADQRLGGRIAANATPIALPLDAPVTLQPSIGYKIALIDEQGAVVERTLTTAAGTVQAVSVNTALSAAPEPGTPFIIYDPAAINKLYRVVSTAENDDQDGGFYSISAVQYAPEKYALIDSINDLPPLPDNPYLTTGVNPPSGLIVNNGIYTGQEGIRRYLDISWSASTDRFLQHYVLSIRFNAGESQTINVAETSFRLNNPLAGTYDIELRAVSILGAVSTSISVSYTLGEIYAVESVSVTNLALKTGGNTFAGQSAELIWTDDALAVLGYATAYGSGTGGQSPWFRDYQIDLYDGPDYANYLLNGGTITPIRTEFATEAAYHYTYAKNMEDGGPRRAIAIIVRARDMLGRYSQAASLQISNPLPAAVLGSSVRIHHGYLSLVVSYDRPTDNDWAGVIVFLSTTNGFAPNRATHQAYIGADTSITLTGLTEGQTYYLRIASFDAFYDPAGSGTDYTLLITQFAATVNPVAAAMTPAQIKSGLQSALEDPAATPLIFDADIFALNLQGTDKTPFIVGVVNGSPAILLDADVGITGSLSASQVTSGTLAATETIRIGSGNAAINGDGSIVIYDGPDNQSNRDFVMLSAGTLTFQRYRGGAYREYKSVRRVEYGQANSGDTVTLPGYWDAQPRLIVSPASLTSYDTNQSESSQTWSIRAENLAETSPGSGIYEFDAVAELNYAESAGIKTVASQSGALSADSWTSAESILPGNTVSIVVTVQISSIKGNGTSTHGFYFRSVQWSIQGWNGAVWIDLASKTRIITQAEHGQQITDTQGAATAGYSKIRAVFTAANTNGNLYSQGSDEYDYASSTVLDNGATANIVWYPTSSSIHTVTLNGGAYSPPSGWSIYRVVYSGTLAFTFYDSTPNGTGVYANSFVDGNGVQLYANSGMATAPNLGGWNLTLASDIVTQSYNQQYWRLRVGISQGGEINATLSAHQATVYIKRLISNSATPQNNYTLQTYAWNISSSTAIATGSLNWMAIGD